MIVLGASEPARRRRIVDMLADRGLEKVKVLSWGPFDPELPPEVPSETIEYAGLIKYVYFYRLLQEIDRRTLVVVNECLRTRDRGDLTYNCVRRYLNQAGGVLVFQTLPMVWRPEDWLILFDWDTDSRWRRSGLEEIPRGEAEVVLSEDLTPCFEVTEVEAPAALRRRYERERDALFASLSAPGSTRDPHILPRTLHLLGGGLRAANATDYDRLLVRNQRLRLPAADSYGSERAGARYAVVDLPHDRKSFVDAITTTRQVRWPVMATTLPVDRWYVDRYRAWAEEVRGAYAAALSG